MPNRLARETSPYLQQHADNPVDWYPWGEEALAEAKRTGKPILLSVGYSACHWCHVMAHESFENPEIARVMNDNFVNIKVDREERPDIDQIYQVAQAMLTQRNGGWPLTMFLTPDQMPFFGGTYFPDRPKYGMPGFGDLLVRVRTFYDENPDDIRAQGEQLVQALARTSPGAGGTPEFDALPLDEAATYLAAAFDSVEGGFSGAPKFPHPDTIELLMRRFAALGDPASLERALLTLRKMAEGGIFDQLGGGFARYSVDERWAIPHFEKMLYDNGWLLRLYADAWAITRDPLFKRVCEETAAWVMREMQSPEGGYYSSLDADSEGHEGKFYVWTPAEVSALLTPAEYKLVAAVYGLDHAPNFEDTHWHFVVAFSHEMVAKDQGIDVDVARRMLDSARAKLLAARGKRVRPGRDEKILASWNALMIGGMAHAARVLGKPEWLASSRRALDFIRREMWRDGKLLATAKDGRAHLDAYLDDHAYLLAALLEVMQADFDPRDLDWATKLGRVLLGEFLDPVNGAFFFTSHDHETLIHRPKPGPDNATPSGNAVAALSLSRLSFLTGEAKFSEAAAGTLALFWPHLERQPAAFGTMLAALEERVTPTRTLVVTGPRGAFGPWHELLDAAYLPTTLVLFMDSTKDVPPALAKPVGTEVNAYLCEGPTCLAPIRSPGELAEKLTIAAFQPATTNRSPAP
jgi:uncharacterized protein YyaL (SSP411 family)